MISGSLVTRVRISSTFLRAPRRLGVTRQAFIKVRLADSLVKLAALRSCAKLPDWLLATGL